MSKIEDERFRKYHSTNVYTRSYIRHRTVRCEGNKTDISQPDRHKDTHAQPVNESGATSRVAHRFGSDKLYIVSAINASIVSSVFVV